MASLMGRQSSLAVYQTYSTTDLASIKSSTKSISRESLLREKWIPVVKAPDIDPRANLELTYPTLNKFVNNQFEWDATLQLLKVTLQIINDKRIFRKKTDVAQYEDLKLLYRNWWLLVRNNLPLQNATVRKLSKFIKDFLVAALEDASHAVKMAVLGTDKVGRLSVRDSIAGPFKADGEKRSAQRLSSQFSHPESQTPTIPKAGIPLATKLSVSGKLSITESKTTQLKPKAAVTASQSQLPTEMSVDMFATTVKSMVNEDELYMQIIVKDILSDISARELERQKKIQHASDEAARGHRSSATTGEHARIPFGSKRMSGKTIKSRIPLHAIKTSKMVGSVIDNKLSSIRHTTSVSLKNLLEASYLRNELREKIENIKLRNERQDATPIEGVKSMKEKVHLKLRANAVSQTHSYVRPLGKK